MDKREDVIDLLGLDYDAEFIFIDGHDNAIIGVVSKLGFEDSILYDVSIIIEELEKQGMTREEALEYFDYNIAGSYVGEKTPAFATLNRK